MMERTFSIIDFGACSTTDELQTRYIQAAIDECFLQGGGEVQIPEGTFLTGGIRLRSNVCLHLMENAHLKGIRDPEAYGVLEDDVIEPIPNNDRTVKLYHTPTADENFQTYEWFNRAGSRWNHGLIRAAYAKNVSVIGECGSALDGSDCYDALGEELYRGPHLMNFFYCENITLRGYTCVDSANWAHAFFYSKNLIIEKVKIYNERHEEKYKIVLIDPHASIEKDIGGLEDSKILNFETIENSLDLFVNSKFNIKTSTELILELCKNLLSEIYNSKLERVLRYSIMLLLQKDKFNFTTLRKLLLNLEYRNKLLENEYGELPDNVVEFFLTDFNELKTKSYQEAISPILSFVILTESVAVTV